MLKKTVILAAVVMGLSLSAQAREYGSAGCGLGSVLFGNEGPQILAATTNGSFYSQVFGITSGTSGCVPDDKQAAIRNLGVFVAANQVSLADDIARGNGETMITMAGMLGCSDAGVVSKTLQGNFSAIFPAANVHPFAVSEAVIDTLKAEPSAGCKNLI